MEILHQLSLVVHSIIHDILAPSQVVGLGDFWTINGRSPFPVWQSPSSPGRFDTFLQSQIPAVEHLGPKNKISPHAKPTKLGPKTSNKVGKGDDVFPFLGWGLSIFGGAKLLLVWGLFFVSPETLLTRHFSWPRNNKNHLQGYKVGPVTSDEWAR